MTIARRQYIAASNERINQNQDGITTENVLCKTDVGAWKKEKDGIAAKYAPDIAGYKKTIDSIQNKYQPDIRQCQQFINEQAAERDEEISRLQSEREREIQLGNNEIAKYKENYKQTEKDYNSQIRAAKSQNKPTARMENSKMTRLNSIKDQIQKVENRVTKKISGIDQDIDVAQSKYDKQISKAKEKFNKIIADRDRELKEPTGIYNGLIQDRDGQIQAIQSRIEKRESQSKNRIDEFNNNISNEKTSQEKHHQKIDQEIVTLVMSGDTCFSEVLDEVYAPFFAIQDRVNMWMEMLHDIKKDKMVSVYPKEHEKQRALLAAMDYQSLTGEISRARRYPHETNIFAKHNEVLKIIGVALFATGVVLAVLLHMILRTPLSFACLLAAALGIALTVFIFVKTNKEFARVCKFISLATDYREFPGISSHSTQVTQERELAKMKNLGSKLYDVHYGQVEAQKAHDDRDADIKSDYENELRLITVELQNTIDEYMREKDEKVNKIEEDVKEGRQRFADEKSEARRTVKELEQKVESIRKDIESIRKNIKSIEDNIKSKQDDIKGNERFAVEFESNYRKLEEKLQDSKWITPMSYGKGKLEDRLYVIPEKRNIDDYGHKKIYCIKHNKKPLVVTYDISGIGHGGGSQVEETGKIIHDLMFDLMYAVYRMNSKDIYAQYVVDEIGGTNDLKNNNVKNAFNIVEVAGKVDDIRGRLKVFATQRERFAEKGTWIDKVNEDNFRDQERPEVYNILYIIYKPNEQKSRLDDDISRLIPECDKYGFLPIFICEAETWNRGINEKDSMYKDIRSLLNNPVVSYDGTQYVS